MYTPAQFKVEDIGEAHALMRARPFAVLVTMGGDGPHRHAPADRAQDRRRRRRSGASNAISRAPTRSGRRSPPDIDALMIFQGPEAYVRPGWYPSKAEHGKVVPTWNYAVVHAYGRLEVVQDQAWLLAHVSELTRPAGGALRRTLGDLGRAGELSWP